MLAASSHSVVKTRSVALHVLVVSFLIVTSSALFANDVVPVREKNAGHTLDARLQSIDDYSEHLDALEETHGTYSQELVETLQALGSLYLSGDRQEEAVGPLERAEYIIRMNQGLYSENLIPVTEALIESYQATGKTEEAEDKLLYLIFLTERLFGENDLRTVSGLESYADWQMRMFDQTIRFDFKGLASLGQNGFTDKRSRRLQAFEHLEVAVTYYGRAINALVYNEAWGDPRLRQFENRLLEAFFLSANHEALLTDADEYLRYSTLQEDMRSYERPDSVYLAYQNGITVYARLMRYVIDDTEGNLQQYADALMALGDWHMLFGRKNLGFETYRKARLLLVEQSVSEASINEILTPAAPLSLPSFTRQKNSRFAQTTLVSNDGKYVDVMFRLNRNGNARDIRIIDSSFDLEKSVERGLKRHLQHTLFRPRFNGEELALGEEVTVRYALND